MNGTVTGDETEAWVGRELDGGWCIVGRLATGGVATTWRAERGDEHAVVKVLAPLYADIAEHRARFLHEREVAEALGAVAAAVLAQGTVDGRPYLVFEEIAGTLLATRIAAGPMAPRDAVATARAVLRALARVHGAGYLHLDLKPANVIVTDGGEVRLLDFGLARRAHDDGEADSVGTPAYAAPERIQGDGPVDARADVYAVGVMLYEMLAGKRPFVGTPVEVMRLHVERDAPPLPVAVSPALDRVVMAALARDPAGRPPSVEAMDLALAGVPESAP